MLLVVIPELLKQLNIFKSKLVKLIFLDNAKIIRDSIKVVGDDIVFDVQVGRSIYALDSKKLKILGTGEIKEKINIEADLVSKSALKKIEKIGGSIQLKK